MCLIKLLLSLPGARATAGISNHKWTARHDALYPVIIYLKKNIAKMLHQYVIY